MKNHKRKKCLKETKARVGKLTSWVRKAASHPFVATFLVLAAYSTLNPDLFDLSSGRIDKANIYNAINIPLNNFWPFATGLTSWTPYAENGNIYFIELLTHIPATIARTTTSLENTYRIQRAIDLIVIASCIALFSNLLPQILQTKKETSKVLATYFSAITLTINPWMAYTIYKSYWPEPAFMLFILFSINYLKEFKIKRGSFFLWASFLIHYQYAFFISLFYTICHTLQKFNLISVKTSILPPAINKCLTTKRQMAWAMAGLLAFPIYIARTKAALALISDPRLSPGGSSVLSRIGIDGNYHAGGILSSIQFLGGYKWTTCFQINNFNSNTPLGISREALIAIANCNLTLIGTSIISLGAIWGLARYLNKKSIPKSNTWMLAPIISAFIGMLSTFQQSYAVHIRGYSFVWAFIFTAGSAMALKLITEDKNWPYRLAIAFLWISVNSTLILASLNVAKKCSMIFSG